MSTARTHARNLAANWGGHVASLVVMFFLSPFVVHSLGKVEYGIWSLLTVFTGYMGVLDLGVRASTGRYVILYLGKGDHESLDQTVRTSLGLYTGLGVLCVIVGALLGWLFPSFFDSVPADYVLLTQLLLPLLALNLFFSALQGVFSSVLAAHDRFDLTRGVDLAILAVQTTGTVVALNAGFGITGLALVTVGCRMLAVVGNFFLARRIYPRLKMWPLQLHRSRLRELFGYGLAACVSMVAFRIIAQTNLVVVGAAIDVEMVTVYSVGAMAIFYANTFLRQIKTTLFPAIQRAIAAGRLGEGRWLFQRASRLTMTFGLLVWLGMLTFAEPFIRLWMYGPEFGDESVRQAALVMQLLAASKFGTLFAGASVSVLNAMGHVKLTATLAAIEAVCNLSLSLLFVLVFGWGLPGVAGATLAARVLVGTFFSPWFACKKLGASWPRYLLQIGGMGVLTGALFYGVCLLVQRIGPADTWIMFFAQVGLATAIYGILAMALLVPKEDRQRVWRKVMGRSRALSNEEST